jgi:hypothetical protein
MNCCLITKNAFLCNISISNQILFSFWHEFRQRRTFLWNPLITLLRKSKYTFPLNESCFCFHKHFSHVFLVAFMHLSLIKHVVSILSTTTAVGLLFHLFYSL